jgi:hypothetical protein
MNNDYDREEPVSLSEGPRSLSKAGVGMCKVCGIYKAVEGPSWGSWEGLSVCPACYRLGRKNLAEISEVHNAGG